MREFEERGAEVQALVGHARRKWFGWVKSVDYEELEAEGVFYVYKNAWKYDPERASFSTFVIMTAKSGMSMFLRGELDRMNKCVNFCDFDLLESAEKNDVDADAYNIEVMRECVSGWTKSRKKVADKLFSGMMQKDVAKELGCSRQYVSYVMKDLANKVKERYEYVDGVVSRKRDREMEK